MEGVKTLNSIPVVISVTETASKDLSESNKSFTVNYLGGFRPGVRPRCAGPERVAHSEAGRGTLQKSERPEGQHATEVLSTPDGQKADLCQSWDRGLPLLRSQRILNNPKSFPQRDAAPQADVAEIAVSPAPDQAGRPSPP